MHISNFKIKRGFTLVETLVVLAINAVILVAVMMSIQTLYRTNAYSIAQTQEIESSRQSIQNWVRDTREMTPAEDGSFPIARAEEDNMGFFSDVDDSPDIEYVAYQLSSSTLTRYIHTSTGSPPSYDFTTPDESFVISENVQNADLGEAVFRYYDSTGTEILNPSAMISDIRYIEIILIVNVDPIQAPGEFRLEGSVAPRNIKDNL